MATVVQFQTIMGSTFEVNLFDQITPVTVNNFLEYVEDDAYQNTVIHRSVDGFVIQGGGFVFIDSFPPEEIPEKNSIDNEPVLSNRRGTIAMAKISGNPNSATSQWFINLSNNSSVLDAQNGGFTVFGQVISGMDVVDEIADIQRFNAGGAFSTIPLRDYTSDDANGNVALTDEHLVLISDIVVTNAAEDSAAALNPALNKNYDSEEDDSSSGAFDYWSIFLLALLMLSYVNRLHINISRSE